MTAVLFIETSLDSCPAGARLRVIFSRRAGLNYNNNMIKNGNGKIVFLMAALALVLALLMGGCGEKSDATLSFKDLTAHAGDYNGKTVTVRAYFFGGFEITALTAALQTATGDLTRTVPTNPMIWMMSKVAFQDQLSKQTETPSGYPEYFGEVIVTGQFETGGQYGHMNAYQYQLTATSVKVLK
jgi:hypothetical protein